ncbi:MAG: hypothetical protein ACK4YP_09275 [Myxococcota bacterium]
MEPLLSTFRDAGPMAFVQVALLLGGGVWALVCAVLLALRWRVPPVVAIAPLLASPLLVTLGATLAESQVTGALALVDPPQRATLLAAGVAESLAQGWFGLLAAPVAFLLAIGGLAAGVRSPRAWGTPALVFLAAGLTALLPLVGLAYDASVPGVLARVVAYGVCAIPLALATASAHPKTNGPEGGMVAAAAWVSLVGASELAVQTAAWTRGFTALAYVSPEDRDTIVKMLVEEVGTQATLGWVIFAVSAVPLLLCALRSGPEPTEEEILAGDASPSPWRSLGRFLALAVWPAWALALLSIDATETLETIRALTARG